MLKNITILLFIGLNVVCFSQSPPHFILGEKELSGFEIYGITQDNQRNLWITTNNGVVKYDGYNFKRIPQEKTILTSSFFSPTVNNKGNVFCANLKGDVLKVVNDTLKVFFKDPSNKKSLRTYFRFSEKDKLLVLSSNLYLVDSSLNNEGYKVIYSLDRDNRIFSDFVCTSNNEYMFYLDDSLFYSIYVDSNFMFKKKQENYGVRNINRLNVNDTALFFDEVYRKILKKDGRIYSYIKEEEQINEGETVRYATDGHLIWVLKNNNGALVYSKDLKPLFNKQTLFKDKLISFVFKDKENNILLGTFNNGIVVIPNINITTIKHDGFYYSNIENSNNRLFASTSDNTIIEFDRTKNYHLIKKTQNKVSYLSGLNKTESLFYYDNKYTVINLKNHTSKSFVSSALKDITHLNKNNYLIAHNKGVQIRNLLTNKKKRLNDIKDRTYHISYDSNTNIIYAGTVNGLKIGFQDDLKNFKYDNEPIMVNDITLCNKLTYVGSKNNGIFIFKGSELIKKIGGDSLFKRVKHIKIFKKNIYAITDRGLCVINLKYGKIIDFLTEENGYYFENINDLEIWNNELWSVSNNELQIINLHDICSRKNNNDILLSELKVNDSVMSFSDSIFDYSKTKFKFTFSSPTIKYKNEVFYKFKLEGIDDVWQTNNYINNTAIYKSLPPGKYTFKVKKTWRETESNIASYNFTISHPFWSTWWFYLLIAALFVTITVLFARVQIVKQKRKNKLKEELNLSKLIAIQSQMNPHFIFNAINSIQDLILHGGVEESYDYVVKFSQLVRKTLTFSNKEFIDFSDEISLLSVYLEIEKLRFKTDFEYEIILNNIIDIEIPPMLIQPFVENAIKHGLLHKEGLKKVSVSFELKDVLICTITDNGIGREASAKIKERQKRNYESFSTSATARRFDIMKEHYEQKVGFVYEDLVTNGIYSGTKVILNMPYKI